MRDPRDLAGRLDGADLGGNVVAFPNVVSGPLAELLAAAAGPAQPHELRGELAAGTAFRAASASWPARRRRTVRTPVAVAVGTMASLLVATTGLAAATELPGTAGRSVQGMLGAVGLHVGPPPVAAPPAPAAPVAAPTAPPARVRSAVPVRCAPVSGAIETASCTIHAFRPAQRPAAHHPVVAAPAAGAAATGGHRAGRTTGPRSGHVPTTTVPTTDPIGGGTRRGGNISPGGTGGGSCTPGAPTSTTVPSSTVPSSTVPSTTVPSTTETTTGDPTGAAVPAADTPVTTVPSATTCTPGGKHHRDRSGGSPGTSTTVP